MRNLILGVALVVFGIFSTNARGGCWDDWACSGNRICTEFGQCRVECDPFPYPGYKNPCEGDEECRADVADHREFTVFGDETRRRFVCAECIIPDNCNTGEWCDWFSSTCVPPGNDEQCQRAKDGTPTSFWFRGECYKNIRECPVRIWLGLRKGPAECNERVDCAANEQCVACKCEKTE